MKPKVYLFEEHNEAFYYWEKSRLEGIIKPNATLIHIDSHSDLGLPKFLDISLYSFEKIKDLQKRKQAFKKFAMNNINIGNFILPAVLRKTINKIYLIFPKRIKSDVNNKKTKKNIGSLDGKGKILTISTDKKKNKFFPDLKSFETKNTSLKKIIEKKNIILDIDLDYFCCNINAVPLLAKIEITKRQYDEFIKNRILPDYFNFNYQFKKNNRKYFLERIPKNNIKCIYDTSKNYITKSIFELFYDLKKQGIKPALITIVKSKKSGYLPNNMAKYVQKEFNKYLILFLKNKAFPQPKINIIKNKYDVYDFVLFIKTKGVRLYNAYSDSIFDLNKSSAFVFDKIAKNYSVKKIIEFIINKYKMNYKEAKKECIKFINRLYEKGIIYVKK